MSRQLVSADGRAIVCGGRRVVMPIADIPGMPAADMAQVRAMSAHDRGIVESVMEGRDAVPPRPMLESVGREILEATLMAPVAPETPPEFAGPVPGLRAAVEKVVERLRSAHEADLDAGEAHLHEHLAASHGDRVLADPRVVDAVGWVLHSDRAAHAVARGIVAEDLAGAIAAPAGERDARVDGVLAAEHKRIADRARTRMPRATQMLVASGVLSS